MKSKHWNNKRILQLAALLVLVTVTYSLVREYSRRAILMDHAIWLSRYWEPGTIIPELISKIEKEQSIHIDSSQWKEGTGNIAIIGPDIAGKRILITNEKMILRIPKNEK